uniref:NADH dehydrogenase subunit 2 n=1 Tax=Sirodotia delicatula TaxID=386631 RepID=A0A343UY34_9FLOR|nr:NADH dehydrogenase subunit 2 [Sirodotia delicatula]AVK39591.1 NADH dehydrogenase subunit 2 [Sirodotia delicatula]
MYDIYSIFPEVYILLCITLLTIYGVLYSISSSLGFPVLGFNTALICFQIVFFAMLVSLTSSDFTIFSWNQLLIHNSFTSSIKFILLITFNLWVLLAIPYATYEKLISFEYWILSLLALVGMLFVVQTCDLLSMYLSIEFQSLVFYVLASFKRTSEFSTEAGLKYFILGAFSSSLLLFGSSLLYGLTGLTNFNDYLKLAADTTFPDNNMTLNYAIAFAITAIITSLLFKMSAAPFHVWSPDVYEGAPTTTTAFFSILPKLVLLSLSLRFCFLYFYDFFYLWQNIILFCTYLSILIGTFSAFKQTKFKRFLAYSSINHVGFILLGFSTGELEGTFAVLFYVITYIILMLGTFLFLTSLRYYYFPEHHQIRYIKDLFLLSEVNPALAASLSLLLFSMAGIPPLLGFFSKIFILLPSLQNSTYGLSIFAVLMSCISCFYYIRLIKIMYFDKISLVNWTVSYPMSNFSSILLSLFVFLSTFLFLDLELLVLFSARLALVI